MDTLKDKRFENFDYTSRYTSTPFYYDTLCDRDIYGIGYQIDKDVEWVAHKVKQTDTLDYLALKYYNNPTYWHIIAYFNDIQDAFIKLDDYFEILRIPRISSVKFTEERKY